MVKPPFAPFNAGDMLREFEEEYGRDNREVR